MDGIRPVASDVSPPPNPIWNNLVPSGLAATLCICVATYVVWRMLGKPMFGIDDANIFFVYAQHFAHGHGIVYNVGGEHVEGFTSTLYFLLCSLTYLVSRSPEMILLWVNLLFTLLTSVSLLFVLNQLADCLHLGRAGKLLLNGSYLLWLLLNPAYFAWSVLSLMDSGTYSLFLTLGYAFLANLLLSEKRVSTKHSVQLGLLSSLCILSRPEGIGWAILQVGAFAFICRRQNRSIRAVLQLVGVPFALVVLTYAGLTGFREIYFGYPLPNTFYAKVSSSTSVTFGYGYAGFKLFLRLFGLFFILPFCAGLAWVSYSFIAGKQKRGRLFWFSTLTTVFIAAGLAMPVAEGGDHFAASRMFQYVYPLLGMSLFVPLLASSKSRNLSFDGLYLVCVGVMIAFTSGATWTTFRLVNLPTGPGIRLNRINGSLGMRASFALADQGRLWGSEMNRVFDGALPSIGIAAAGGVAYIYHGISYDLMGLNDTRMAHANKFKTGPKDHGSFNAGIFYHLKPDVLMPVPASQDTKIDLQAQKLVNYDPQNFENQIYKGLFQQSLFRSLYVLAAVSNPADPHEIVSGYFRKTYLNNIVRNHGFKVVQSVTL